MDTPEESLTDHVMMHHPDATWLELMGGTGLVAARGKLIICKCIRTAWKCEVLNGTTRCKEVCTEWKCVEVPTVFMTAIGIQ